MSSASRIPVAPGSFSQADTITEICATQAMTEFHYLLLGQNSLHIYSRISGQLVQQVAISGPGGVLPAAQGASSMLLRDAEAAQVYLVAGEYGALYI